MSRTSLSQAMMSAAVAMRRLLCSGRSEARGYNHCMHFLVTGGRSDVARATVEGLVARGHRVSWLGPSLMLPGRRGIIQIPRHDAPWRVTDFRGLDGILHLAGPHPNQHLSDADPREQARFVQTLFRRAADAGVQRAVAIGVVSNPRVQDHPFVRTKQAMEQAIRDSGIPATIFRAPWLYGSNDDFLTRLWKWIRGRNVLLVPGLSQAPVQLCSETLLADAIVQAIERPPGRLRIYEAATASPISLGELITQLGLIVRGKAPVIVPVSRHAFSVRGPLRVVGLIPLRSPMWTLLESGLTCATVAFERDFGIRVQPARRALIEFVRSLDSGTRQSGRHISRAAG
ncbi:MAG: NAD(P)-dependent oxidoreductase [Candidatus Dadabacteria bacterium]|nr:MAG: NAD(P)-dependent oxidoreductase [Candidatus Dadabacteria bacterium]